MFNDPGADGRAAAFVTSASNIGYAFNWFYVNSAEAAYFNSGSNPVRPGHVDPNLPIAATAANEWVGWNPDTNTATYTPVSAHPQAVNQDYFVSWNNKQAKDYSAADGNFSFGPVHRGDMLDKGVQGRHRGRAEGRPGGRGQARRGGGARGSAGDPRSRVCCCR